MDIYAHIRKLFSFLKLSKVNLWYLVLSVVLSLAYTLFTMYSVSLLFPLTQGIIKGDFAGVAKMNGISFIVAHSGGFFNSSIKLFILLLVWVYLTSIIQNGLNYLAFLSTQYQSKLATVKLRQLLVTKCLDFGKKFYDNNTISYIQGILTKSTSLIESQFKLIQRFIIQLLLLIVYFYMMIRISWKLTLVAVVIFPVVSLFTKKLIKKIEEATLAYAGASMNLNDKIFDMLHCMPVIKSFVKERREKDNFDRASQEEIEQSFKVQKLSNLAGPVQDIGTTTGILFVALGLAAIMRVDHALDATNAIIFFYLAMKIIPGMNAMNDFKLGAAGNVSAIQDVEHILNQDEASLVIGGAEKFVGLKDEIIFKDLVFSYEASNLTNQGSASSTSNKLPHNVLNGVNFSVKKGSVTAIVGPTGSGKSTLVNLLLRFYDCPAGSIWLDGHDIRDYDVHTVRDHMAYVSQDVLLFNDTVRNNLMYGVDHDLPDATLFEIGERTHVHPFVSKMNKQYDTKIGEKGGKLSGGERQRLSITRAMIKNPEILILDEATSALDSQTEIKISEYIFEAAKGKTVIIIAHRLSTIRRADKVIYLENGRVTEQGTLAELIGMKGSFSKQWEGQRV